MNAPTTHHESLLDISKLPTLPETLIELIEACNNSEVDIYSVGTLVAKDAALSARILQLANSAFLGTRATFVEIEQAVIYLGIDTVRNLAVSVSVHEAFNTANESESINMAHFWHHSLYTALLAKSLAEQSGYPSPAEAYLGGLLHDLGKLLLYRTHTDKYALLLRECPSPEALPQHEEKRFGISHTEAGGLLVRSWKLPEQIAEAIELHHIPQRIGSNYPSLAELLHLANIITDTTVNVDLADHVSGKAPLTPEIISECEQSSLEAVNDIAKAIGITVSFEPESTATVGAVAAGKKNLSDKVYSFSRIQGVLNNLIKAEDTERIYRVLEESMHILFNIRNCLFVLPNRQTGKLQSCCSSTNPLCTKIQDLQLQSENPGPLIEQCLEKQTLFHSATELGGAAPSDTENLLLRHFKEKILLVLPIPIDGTTTGLLLAGVSKAVLQEIQSSLDSMTFLMSQAGARLRLEILSRQHGEELARKQVQAAEQVARSVVHEITNPLAIIQNYISILGLKISEDDAVKNELEIIGDEIERIGNVTRQLRNLSTSASKQKPEKIDLNGLVRDVLTLFQESLFLQQNIRVHMDLDQHLPKLRSLPDDLRQILTILLQNGVEALGEAGQITVTSRYQAASDNASPATVSLIISDNGPGIAPAIADTLFNAGHTTKDDGHLGLGLAIAKKLVTTMGGSLSCVPAESGGAEFTVKLPVQQ